MNELLAMDIHDELTPHELLTILRVPGGWIYTVFCENGTGGFDMSSCFVPFVVRKDG